tara:strand:- start:10512 stop:12380 length:1869 start_codon:yes stop_codon:yes gene_type:complete
MSTTSLPAESHLQALGASNAQPQDWSAEIQSILGLGSDDEFLAAVVSLVASVTKAGGSFLFVPNGPEGRPQCAVSRMLTGVSLELLNSERVQGGISQTIRDGKITQIEVVNHGKPSVWINVPSPSLSTGRWSLSALVENTDRSRLEDATSLLQMVTLLLDQRRRLGNTGKLKAGFSQATLFLELLCRTGTDVELERSVATLANDLKGFVDCHQVAIGIGNRRSCRASAISGAGRFDRRAQPAIHLRAFMEEAIGVDSAICWPYTKDLPREVMVSGNHDRLLEVLDIKFAMAIPLKTEEGDTVGAVVFLDQAGSSSLVRRWELLQAMSPHVAAVTRLMASSKPRGKWAVIRRKLKEKSGAKRLVIGLLVAASMAAMWIPVPYSISARCQLEPVVTRQIAAPFDGVLARPEVKPGAMVVEGQLLATLDGKEIGWRLAEAVSKHDIALKRRAQGIANDDIQSAQLADLEVKAKALEVKILRHHQLNLEVLAPIDGMVLSGDLKQSEGVPVSKGQQLFEIAKIDQLRVEIGVPDSEVSHIRTGMKVNLRLDSQVQSHLETEVDSISPASTAKDNRNVFVCHASIGNEAGLLRPGMQGKARIWSDHRKLGWIVFHKPWETIRRYLWF